MRAMNSSKVSAGFKLMAWNRSRRSSLLACDTAWCCFLSVFHTLEGFYMSSAGWRTSRVPKAILLTTQLRSDEKILTVLTVFGRVLFRAINNIPNYFAFGSHAHFFRPQKVIGGVNNGRRILLTSTMDMRSSISSPIFMREWFKKAQWCERTGIKWDRGIEGS